MADHQNNVVSLFDRPQRVEAKLVRVVARPPSVPSNEAARTSAPVDVYEALKAYSCVRGVAAALLDELGNMDRRGLSQDMRDRATILKRTAEYFLEGFDEPEPPRSA